MSFLFQSTIGNLRHSSSVILNSITNQNRKINKNKSQNEIIKPKFTLITPTTKTKFKLDPLIKLTQNHSMILKLATEESTLITRNKTLTIKRAKIKQSNTMNSIINLSKNNKKINEILIKHSSTNDNNNTNANANANANILNSNFILDFDKVLNAERKFLKSLSENTSLLNKHLSLFKTQLELTNILFNELCTSEYPSFRIIPDDIHHKLLKRLNSYFNTLRDIFFDPGRNKEEASTDCLFNYTKLNSVYKKILKTQMVLYTTLFLLLQLINQDNVYTNLNNHFLQLMKEFSNSMFMLFSNFVYEELIIFNNFNSNSNSNNNNSSSGNGNGVVKALGSNFIYRYHSMIKEYKKSPFTKNSIVMLSINKNLLKCNQSIKCYNSLILKYLLCPQFSKAMEEITNKLEGSCPLKELCSLLINSLLFSLINRSEHLDTKPQIRKDDINVALPYLPPIKAYYALTLVVDLDETLIHFFQSKSKGVYLIRPYCFEFLEQLSGLYEIIVFTAGTKDYADKILNQIDRNNKYFKHRLYRDHVSSNNSFILKDLSKLGRELSKVIIVDNIEDNFSLQPNNGLLIKTWDGDIEDTELHDMTKVLLDLFLSHFPDVRDIIKKINIDIRKRANYGKNIYQSIQISHYY